MSSEEPTPRSMSPIHGWTIVSTEYVDVRQEGSDTVELRRPYAIDLPLYRADAQGDRYSHYRVFWKKEHAEDYIETYLKSDDYRVVPVVVRADVSKARDLEPYVRLADREPHPTPAAQGDGG